jgi:hypothetical protein
MRLPGFTGDMSLAGNRSSLWRTEDLNLQPESREVVPQIRCEFRGLWRVCCEDDLSSCLACHRWTGYCISY